jgi:rhomboid protease GluP
MTDDRRVPDPRSGERASLLDMLHARPREVPVTVLLLAANVLVFLLMLRQGAGFWHTNNTVQLAWGANFGPATQDGQWWRLASALFLHFGIVHLALNMWALWDVGRLVERLYGRWRFAFVYFASGVFGNLLSLVMQGNQAISGGASGAIFSLYGALLVYLWRERRRVARHEFRWLFGIAAGFTVVTLLVGQFVPGIDNAAHAGGLVAGAMLARAMSRPWMGQGWRAQAWRWGSFGLLCGAALALLLHLPAPRYRMGEELRAQAAIRDFLAHDQRISRRFEDILATGPREGRSFDEIAGRLDNDVTSEYQESLDELSALGLSPGAPSARTLEMLRNYAALRGEASQSLAEGLRNNDRAQIQQALRQARSARTLAGRPQAAASQAGPATAPASAPADAASAAAAPSLKASASAAPADTAARDGAGR